MKFFTVWGLGMDFLSSDWGDALGEATEVDQAQRTERIEIEPS